jgi:Zn-dependent alcohol dehydrogenase
VVVIIGINVGPDDLTFIVDAQRDCRVAVWIVGKVGVCAAAVNEAVTAGAVEICADDLTRIVDAKDFGARRS